LQGKQYSVKVYECIVDDEEEFISFFDTNYTLFKDHLIVINGYLSQRIKEYLNSKPLTFFNNVKLPRGRSRRNRESKTQKRECEGKKMALKGELIEPLKGIQDNFTIIEEVVRSGVELSVDGDLLLLNRVNSGANIYAKGHLVALQQIEGYIKCDGDFMILTASSKASIIFRGEKIDNSLLDDTLKKIEIADREIVIRPIFEKEKNWVL
jgi:septum formation inhibitor MinC